MKKLLLPILTCLILAAPTLNAGWADPVAWVEWITHQFKQPVSPEYSEEIKYMKDKFGIKTPTVLYRIKNSHDVLGETRNIGLGSLNVSFVGLNEDIMNRNNTAENTAVLVHELQHVRLNHGHTDFSSEIKWVSLLVGSIMARGLANLIEKNVDDTTFNSAAITTARLAPLAISGGFLYSLLYGSKKEDRMTPEDIINRRKIGEAEAERATFAGLNQLGYCKALEDQKSLYKRIAYYPEDTKTKGELYPDLKEYLRLSELFKTCQGINPSERPDSAHFTRNGVPAESPKSSSWNDWFFRK
jgi:hypothetical protein